MNRKIKVIIVEDEPLARMGLTGYVEDVEFLELCQVCEDALEANNAIHRHKPDLMFLDIQMPRLTGIDFLKSLSHPPMVIFTTAFPNYALQGFELDVIDYLVKPYPFDRFLKAVNKARDLFLLKTRIYETNSKPDHFFVKAGNKLERVDFNSIRYIEAMENYMVIHTDMGHLVTLLTMKAIEDELPGDAFIRIHKSYIVNKNRVRSIDGNEVIVENKKLPISRQKKQEVLNRITKG
jgi:DNA-binding LytR/AlgR family response regulator